MRREREAEMSMPRHQALDLDAVEREAVARVQRLTSGEATLLDVEALKRWRAQNPVHDAAFVEAKRVWDRVGAAGRFAHDAGTDFVAELDAIGRHRKQVTRRAMLGGSAAAVAAAATYGVINPPLGLWPSWAELDADFRTGTGEQRHVAFAGDVTIDLNTQTSLTIRPVQGAEDRIELLTGEASFATSLGAARRLVVLAATGKTMTESGRFDVRYTATSEGTPVNVTCLEGTVRIELGPEASELRAGQHLRYDRAGLSQIVSVDPMVASNWQRGIVEFRGTPLKEAVEEINRYRPGRIILMNAALGQKPVSGRFRIDQMNNVLLQLEDAFSAKLRRLPGGIVLLS
jgi:transmembrane sensor